MTARLRFACVVAIPLLVALGLIAWAVLLPTVDCVRAGDVLGCSDRTNVKILLAVLGLIILGGTAIAFAVSTARAKRPRVEQPRRG